MIKVSKRVVCKEIPTVVPSQIVNLKGCISYEIIESNPASVRVNAGVWYYNADMARDAAKFWSELADALESIDATPTF